MEQIKNTPTGLKTLREKENLDQKQFAKKIGLLDNSSSLVSMWETGRRTPNTSMLKKIGDTFNVQIIIT